MTEKKKKYQQIPEQLCTKKKPELRFPLSLFIPAEVQDIQAEAQVLICV